MQGSDMGNFERKGKQSVEDIRHRQQDGTSTDRSHFKIWSRPLEFGCNDVTGFENKWNGWTAAANSKVHTMSAYEYVAIG